MSWDHRHESYRADLTTAWCAFATSTAAIPGCQLFRINRVRLTIAACDLIADLVIVGKAQVLDRAVGQVQRMARVSLDRALDIHNGELVDLAISAEDLNVSGPDCLNDLLGLWSIQHVIAALCVPLDEMTEGGFQNIHWHGNPLTLGYVLAPPKAPPIVLGINRAVVIEAEDRRGAGDIAA
jgi:hypothetical protein